MLDSARSSVALARGGRRARRWHSSAQLQVLDRLVGLVGDVALVRAPLEQRGARGGRQAVGEAQGARVLRRGLAVGAGARRRARPRRARSAARPRRRRRPRRGRRAAPGRRGSAPSAASARAPVQRRPPVRGERLLDRDARELVPERHAGAGRAEHAARQALLEVLHRRRRRAPRAAAGRPAPGTIAAASSTCRAGGLSGATRASTASRTVAGSSTPPAASASVTKNGFPAVRRCSCGGVDAVRRGELGHRLGRQRREPQPVGRRRGARARRA